MPQRLPNRFSFEDRLGSRAALKQRESSSYKSSTRSFSKKAPSKQVIVKMASHQSSVRGAKNTANYIAGKKDEKHKIFDITGRELARADIGTEIAKWGLDPDGSNLSKKALEATADELAKMKDNEKFNRRQTVHQIVSLPANHKDLTDQQLTDFALEYLKPFREKGHQAVFAIHRHQAKPHLHILMTYRDGEGKAFRTNANVLEKLRDQAVDAGKTIGLEMENNRRVDKEAVRESIVRGHGELKPKTDQTKPKLDIEREVPAFYNRWGLHYELYRAEVPVRDQVPDRIQMPSLHPATIRNLETWAASYENPTTAEAMFKELAAEKMSLAFWMARSRPEVFGKIVSDPKPEVLKDVRLSSTWRDNVAYQMRMAQPGIGDAEKLHEARTLAATTASRLKSDQTNRDKAFLAYYEVTTVDSEFANKWSTVIQTHAYGLPIASKIPDPSADIDLNIATPKINGVAKVYRDSETAFRMLRDIGIRDPEKAINLLKNKPEIFGDRLVAPRIDTTELKKELSSLKPTNDSMPQLSKSNRPVSYVENPLSRSMTRPDQSKTKGRAR